MNTHASLHERLLRNTDRTPGHGPTGDCWLWKGFLKPNGYGQIRLGAASLGIEYVHRVTFFLKEGRYPVAGKEVCHTCDVRHCVNPDHLWEGTRKENMADMTRKGRRVNTPHYGEDHSRHKLTARQVRRIRASTVRADKTASRYGVSVSLIYQIRQGGIWRCLL